MPCKGRHHYIGMSGICKLKNYIKKFFSRNALKNKVLAGFTQAGTVSPNVRY